MPSLYHIHEKKKIAIREHKTDITPEYPVDWFRTDKRKPKVTLQTTKLKDDDIYDVFLGELKKGVARVPTAVSVLLDLASDLKATLKEEWKSYGVVIGKKDDLITPLDLFDHDVEQQDKDYTSTSRKFNQAEKRDVGVLALGLYRLAAAPNEGQYRDKIWTAIINQVLTLSDTIHAPAKLLNFDVAGYSALVSAYDMFFSKFPDHEYQYSRVGSITSRDQNCAALTGLTFLSKTMGVDIETVAQWIFNHKAGSELFKMLEKDDPEIERSDSYFPYQHGFRLVKKSAYSASANPNLHMWIHMVGTLLGEARSRNARVLSGVEAKGLFTAASLVAYGNRKGGVLDIQFAETLPEDGSAPSGPPIGGVVDEPDNNSPTEWFVWYDTSDDAEDKIDDFIQTTIARMGQTREGTVGELIKTL